jgi:hypothetical protein
LLKDYGYWFNLPLVPDFNVISCLCKCKNLDELLQIDINLTTIGRSESSGRVVTLFESELSRKSPVLGPGLLFFCGFD